MNFKELLKDDDAVSPVIGVILMVAITVILAAVIGTFVLGLGEQVQSTSPQASFSEDQAQTSIEDTDAGGGSGVTVTTTTVTITHKSGDTIPMANIKLTVNGNPAYDVSPDSSTDPQSAVPWGGTGDVSAGSQARVVFSDPNPDTAPSYDTATSLTVNTDADPFSDSDTRELQADDVIRVVWTSDSGESSATLFEYTVAA